MTSLYDAGRDQEHLTRLKIAIDAFAWQYLCDARPDKKLIFLFPGGMGSQLCHYNQTFPTPPRDSRVLWLACNFFAAGAEKIWLNKDNTDARHQYVVADDAIDFLSIQPYLGFKGWCSRSSININLFVFGYDWRRSAQEAATYFLGTFMPRLDQKIRAKTHQPLKDYTLVGHSAGGMAVKLIVNDATNEYVKRMSRAITVATPFYGYSGQIQRFLTGMLSLNWNLAEPAHQNRRMAEIIATMPGGYEFLYLDYQTYQDNRDAFNGRNEDKDYRLPKYPCMDAGNPPDTPADPYHPTADGQKVRYPVAPADLPLEKLLCDGLKVSKAVSQRLDDSVAARFYNIRGVQTTNNGRRKLSKTVVRSAWKRIEPGNYNPDADSAHRPKLMVDTLGYGDAVQPACIASSRTVPG